MRAFEYDITMIPASAFQQLVYFCTSDGQCQEEPAPSGTTEKLLELLNEWGQRGWELVNISFSTQGIVAFWKRERE